ncbi:CrcB family protein [Streptomyces sp. SCSIO 30461]|uniref:fluoride efflux transporter FluC n=1 Tax=Streptomyces sp. SCSIO 30461 TaxID=3118085 RepID=UPI0030D0C8FA
MSPGPDPGSGPRRDPGPDEPVDPDIDLHWPEQRAETAGARKWKVLAAVSAGGVIGACVRYGVSLAWASPWATLTVNVSGCALIGVVMVLVSEHKVITWSLARPFLGVGVLGGYTTFSSYALDIATLADRQKFAMAAGYTFATLVGALGAVWLAAVLTRKALGARIAAEAP